MENSKVIGVREASRRLGVHENTVRNWVKAGRLHAADHPGRFTKFDPSEVEQLRELMQMLEAERKREAEMGDNLISIGSKVPKETYDRLRWLAYVGNTTISAIVAEYIATGISKEDFSRFQPPDSR